MQPEHRTIGELAYTLWQSRGCPSGTAEKDWLEAERQLSVTAPVTASVTPVPASATLRPKSKETAHVGDTTSTARKSSTRARVKG